MKFFTIATSMLCMFIVALSISVNQVSAAQRGLAWGTNDSWGSEVVKGLFTWYWHWQDGPNSKFDGKLDFVPCFWGPKYMSQWNARKAEMKKSPPKALLGFNEPDISGQSNLNAKDAAALWMKEIQPWKSRGVRLGSPQIVWDQKWLSDFMSACHKKGCTVDFIAVHWYGSWRDLSGLKNYVRSIHNKHGLPIWVTEYGVTSASGGSQAQVKQFHMDATTWLDSQSYVERSSNFGSFAVSSPPDAFGSKLNALFNSDGSLRSLGKWYAYSQQSRRRSPKFAYTSEGDFLPETPAIDVNERITV